MAHKVGRAVKSMKFSDIGTGKNLQRLGQGIGDTATDMWDAATGQTDPNDLAYAQWQNQEYNPNWNTQGQTATAQGYTGQGYNAVNAAPAQGYDATTGTFQSGEAFNNVLSQAMGASQDFMDPNSNWAKGQQAIVAEQAGQLAGQQTAQQDAMLASRGMGGGGLRGLLGNRAQAEAGAQARQGATNIATQGAQLGLQAMNQAGPVSYTHLPLPPIYSV